MVSGFAGDGLGVGFFLSPEKPRTLTPDSSPAKPGEGSKKAGSH